MTRYFTTHEIEVKNIKETATKDRQAVSVDLDKFSKTLEKALTDIKSEVQKVHNDAERAILRESETRKDNITTAQTIMDGRVSRLDAVVSNLATKESVEQIRDGMEEMKATLHDIHAASVPPPKPKRVRR